jgi:signal transduction histidine kinase
VIGRRAIPVLILIATVLPMGALAWLGVRILQQDRDVERQRRRENLEIAAGRLALAINRRLSDIEEQVGHGSGIRLTPTGADGPGLLYVTGQAPDAQIPASIFADAEALEFRNANPRAAATAYGRLAHSAAPNIRATALNRLGRALRKAGDPDAALAAYAQLQQLGASMVEGEPAALLARQARCRVFESTGDTAALRREAADLALALYSGGWRIDQATFELYREMVKKWGAPPPPAESLARTEAAIALWRAWRAGTIETSARRILWSRNMPVLAVWTGGPDHPVSWFGSIAQFAPLPSRLTMSLYDSDGQLLYGQPRSDAVSLNQADTRLPFILSVAPDGPLPSDDSYRTHRILLITGLVLTGAFMIAAACGLYRATVRELALARQQSDFVSAVSHEFRTPLTSMRHLTELLVSGNVPTESRKEQYYGLLARETERLHRMVESLLSFGRIEAGAYAWHLESVDPRELLPGIVEEFREEPLASGREILCDIRGDPRPFQADREALSRALWNLLDNAGKYSEPGAPIRVFCATDHSHVVFGVEDHGSGIPAGEQERIFQKFTRGAEAKRAGIRGVGIGLALVKSIIEAHGGSVRLESEPGRGSRFLLELPCRDS